MYKYAYADITKRSIAETIIIAYICFVLAALRGIDETRNKEL